MKPTIEQIDAILPQTQCGLCGFNGCKPYAEALAQQNASIDLCPPGGVEGLSAIANLLSVDPAPFIIEMEQKAKKPSRAVIRETECIGCTKCIAACPVDAILGSAKHMHTVITDECTGCELCIAPCPVDCIDMIEVEPSPMSKANQYRERYQHRQARLKKIKHVEKTRSQQPITDKKSYIEAAMLRVKKKKG